MDVYFVRHGETDGNVAFRHQHEKTALNEVGIVQAKKLAEKIKQLQPTHIITSSHLRAVQTSRLIVAECDSLTTPDTNEYFSELRRPSWLTGNRYISLVTAWYVLRWFFNLRIKGDGENYADFLKRIISARQYLETFPEDSRIVVVSHAVFINVFLEHTCTNQRMNVWRAIKRFWHILRIKNANIIHLRHEDRENQCQWTLIT